MPCACALDGEGAKRADLHHEQRCDYHYRHVDAATAVTNIIIPDSINGYPVTTIGNNAFQNCTALGSVIFGRNVTTIGDSAFAGDTALTNAVFNGNYLTTIGRSAFSDCTGLPSIVLPSGVNIVIGDDARSMGTPA